METSISIHIPILTGHFHGRRGPSAQGGNSARCAEELRFFTAQGAGHAIKEVGKVKDRGWSVGYLIYIYTYAYMYIYICIYMYMYVIIIKIQMFWSGIAQRKYISCTYILMNCPKIVYFPCWLAHWLRVYTISRHTHISIFERTAANRDVCL